MRKRAAGGCIQRVCLWAVNIDTACRRRGTNARLAIDSADGGAHAPAAGHQLVASTTELKADQPRMPTNADRIQESPTLHICVSCRCATHARSNKLETEGPSARRLRLHCNPGCTKQDHTVWRTCAAHKPRSCTTRRGVAPEARPACAISCSDTVDGALGIWTLRLSGSTENLGVHRGQPRARVSSTESERSKALSA